MNKTNIAIVAMVALMAAAIIVGLYARIAESKVVYDRKKEEVTELQRRQEVWLKALEWCESRGVESAINKMDRDGTPSYGALQFKPSTYEYFSERYALSSTTDYMNASQQRQIVRLMINDPKISDDQLRNQQFPDCIQHKVGLPPRKKA